MPKIKFFSHDDTRLTEKAVNEFIAFRDVVDIQYQSVYVPTAYDGRGNVTAATVYDRVMVVYREDDL